jgi:tRNA-dihydrouridine synthase B
MNKPPLKEIKIGEHSITPVLLAPMCGVTDVAFRKLVKSFGAGLTISEMIASQAVTSQTKNALQKAFFSEHEEISVVQLAGRDPTILAEAARLSEETGAKIIDLNFGCPVKKVVGGNAGSALMKDLKLAGEIINSAVTSVKVPVTVKMRTGWCDENKNAPDLAKLAEDLGVKMITIHGRTRSQMFQGKADWEFIRTVKEKIKIPVIANGDIKSPDDAKQCLESSGADGIMIGRGVYGKPWLINQIIQKLTKNEDIPPPTLPEILKTILSHYKDIMDLYGDKVGLLFARKHIGWYASSLPNSSKFRMEFNKILSVPEAIEKISSYFEELITRNEPIAGAAS